MKIRLINPTPARFDKKKETLFYASSPPLGLMYLATCLINAGHDVQILDQAAVNYTNSDVIKWIKSGSSDLVGFSVLCAGFHNAKYISKALKIWNPNLKIVFGNYLPTFQALRILQKFQWIDICVRGEGERTFVELVDALERDKPLAGISGIVFRENGKVKETKNQKLIKNLDVLPFPDRKLVPDDYKNRIGEINITKRKFTTMVSSRGCPYKCTFCACRAFHNTTWRSRSVDNILAEICELAGQGFREILFVDDNFTLNKKRIITLCHKIRKEKLDIVFNCDGRVNNSSIEMFRSMKAAKIEVIMFGFESAVQRTLDYYHKNITPQMTETAVKNARKAGFDIIIGSFMIGGLNETYAEAMQTLEFISKLDIDFPHIIFTRALPGTQLFNDLVNKNVINEEKYWETGVDLIDLPEARMKRNVILKIIKEKYRSTFLQLRYVSKALIRTLKNRYRREILLSKINKNDIQKAVRFVNNPPDLF